MQQRREHAGHQIQRAAAEVAQQVHREGRSVVGSSTERVERTGDGDVVHVVPGRLAQRAVLAPAGHPAVDEGGVAGEAVVRTDAETLGDAGPEALEQHVGLLDEPQHGLDATRVLQVEGDRRPTAAEQVLLGARDLQATPAGPVDAHHVGAEVGEHHGRERPGPDTDHLDDAYAVQGSRVDRHTTIVTVVLSRCRAPSVLTLTLFGYRRYVAASPRAPRSRVHPTGHPRCPSARPPARHRPPSPGLGPGDRGARPRLRRHRPRPVRVRGVACLRRWRPVLDGQRVRPPADPVRAVGRDQAARRRQLPRRGDRPRARRARASGVGYRAQPRRLLRTDQPLPGPAAPVPHAALGDGHAEAPPAAPRRRPARSPCHRLDPLRPPRAPRRRAHLRRLPRAQARHRLRADGEGGRDLPLRQPGARPRDDRLGHP